jgi:hypothetical protein
MTTETQQQPYTLAKEYGAWVIRHQGVSVRACHSERIARLYLDEWNRNRQPSRQALVEAFRADWQEATA